MAASVPVNDTEVRLGWLCGDQRLAVSNSEHELGLTHIYMNTRKLSAGEATASRKH